MSTRPLLAIEEINTDGGLLGRAVRPKIADGRSDWTTYADQARDLITDGAEAIFGGYTSASRRSIVPIIEKQQNLLFYPTFYEGIQRTSHVVYTGGVANQFVLPAVDWLHANHGSRYFVVGSDYVFPRATGAIIRDRLSALGGEVIGEEYLPLGDGEVEEIITKITDSKPDVIISLVVGDSNIPFYRGLRAAGITPERIPTLSLVIGETELQSMSAPDMAGDLIALNYFQSIEDPDSTGFVDRFHTRFGSHRGVSDPMEAAYVGVHLWAQSVRRAGTTSSDQVLKAIRGERFAAPEGEVQVDENSLHLTKRCRIGRITVDGQLDLVWSSPEPITPEPYLHSRPEQEWNDMVTGLYNGWGGNWAAPEPSRL